MYGLDRDHDVWPIDIYWNANRCFVRISEYMDKITDETQQNEFELRMRYKTKIYVLTDGSKFTNSRISRFMDWQVVKLILQMNGFLPEIEDKNIILSINGKNVEISKTIPYF
jgi:hypothetical protein